MINSGQNILKLAIKIFKIITEDVLNLCIQFFIPLKYDISVIRLKISFQFLILIDSDVNYSHQKL